MSHEIKSTESDKTKLDLATLIGRRTFGVTIAIALSIGISIASWIKIPVEVMPKENTPPFLYLRVESKEPMAPERLELALALPVEGAVRTVPGLMKFNTSTSGRSVSASLTFKPRTNLDVAEFNLQEALQDLEARGLLDMRGVSISRLNPEASAVMKLSVTYDSSIKDPVKTIKDDLRIALESIGEVSKIEISGIEPVEYEYRIPASQVQELGLQGQGLSAFISFSPLREALGEASFGSTDFMKSVNARLLVTDLQDLQGQSVARGSTFTLREIASERVVDKTKQDVARKNGVPAVFVEIFAKEGASLFELDHHVKETLKKITLAQNEDISKLNFEPIFNKTDDLSKAINDVFEALYEAVGITFIIVLLFLRSWRPTILISLTIPLTLLMTILVLYSRGISLNILTLSGLILGIGMVVDSAVLVVGRIGELRATGLSPRQAAAKGATDVMPALIMSTLTNAAIFLPVAFIEGGDSFTDILKAFQMPILASLGASLIVALVFLPVLMIHWRERKSPKTSASGENDSARVIQWFRWIQSRRSMAAALSIAFIWAVVSYVADIRETDLESPRDNFTTLSVKFAPETRVEQRKLLFEKFEKDVLTHQREIGYKFVVADFNPKFLNGSVLIYPDSGDDIDVALDLQEKNLKTFVSSQSFEPGMTASVGWAFSGSSTAQRRSDTLRFSGPKMAKLVELTAVLKEKLLSVPGVEEVKLEKEETGERSLIFIPSEPVLHAYKISLSSISQHISTMMASASVTNLSMNGKAVAAKISFVPKGLEWSMESLKTLRIPINETHSVNLIDLGTLTPSMITGSITRNDGTAMSRVYVYYKQSMSEPEWVQSQTAVRQTVQAFRFPQGYGTPPSDTMARIEEMQKKSQFIILLSALLIYLLLASMFESFLLPFAIMFTVPLALIFGVAGLRIMGLDLDVMARLSLIILVGIGVNGAIILIDLINHLRSQGIRRSDAVVLGCARRLRAVLMTTAIQIISVLPVALGKAKIMGIPYSSLGVSIISGMLLSTAVTLVILPMVYEWLDEIETRIKRFLHSGQTREDLTAAKTNQDLAA